MKRLTLDDMCGLSDIEALVLYYAQARNELEAAMNLYDRDERQWSAPWLARIEQDLAMYTAKLTDPDA